MRVKLVKKLILENRGENKVLLAMDTDGKKEIIKLSRKYDVNLSRKFMRKLVGLVGIKKIKIR